MHNQSPRQNNAAPKPPFPTEISTRACRVGSGTPGGSAGTPGGSDGRRSVLRDPGPPCAEAPFSRGFHLDACRAAPGEARRGEARGGFSGPASRPEGPPLAAGCPRPPSGDGFPGGPSRRSPGRVGVRVGVRARRAEPGLAMLPPCLRPRRLLPAPPSRPAATGGGPARGPGAGRGKGRGAAGGRGQTGAPRRDGDGAGRGSSGLLRLSSPPGPGGQR